MLGHLSEERLQAMMASEPLDSAAQVERFLDCGWGLIPGYGQRIWADWTARKSAGVAARREMEARGLMTNIAPLDY